MLNNWQLREIIEKLGISAWGGGYFSIDHSGEVICTPKGESNSGVSLTKIIKDAKKIHNISAPMIIRFPQVIKEQLKRMNGFFHKAIREFDYKGNYRGVFPFKVNQRREFIDAVVSCGQDLHWGLEVGSKSEFIAALSYKLHQDALLVCNGFKDREFIDLAFVAQSMGRKVILVVEGPDELELVIQVMKEKNLSSSSCPQLGLRIRLSSKGSGKWEKSSGATSKFGLTTSEVIRALKIITDANLQERLSMLHFHIGSQITVIKSFKNALREAARVYSKIIKMGFTPKFLNIGGGVGIDYDGSKSSSQSSANYSLEEFANDAVYVIGDVCKNEGVIEPDIVTESGRVIAAYHSVVVADIREVQGEENNRFDNEKEKVNPPAKNSHKYIKELYYVLTNMNGKNFVEYYHDAIEYHEDLLSLFTLGYLDLEERSMAETLFNKVCIKALHYSSFQNHSLEEFESLKRLNVSKYLANFSIFQSIPDAWSIGQLFPILPLSRHGEKTTHKASIVDITCDSDGCIEKFIDHSHVEKTALDLHSPNGSPYYLGFFLVGAYQESLANEHNLFGAINEVEVVINHKGEYEIVKTTPGDPIKELLISRNYSSEEMISSYKDQIHSQLKNKKLEEKQAKELFDFLVSYLDKYPYLTSSSCPKFS
jgi:arginine decarboxylase